MPQPTIRIWRYNATTGKFECLSEGWARPIEIDKKSTPYAFQTPSDRDFLIERGVSISQLASVPNTIPPERANLIPDKDIPAAAGIWHWDGDSKVSEVYRRSTASAPVRELVEAFCNGDEEFYIIYCGPGENTGHRIFYPSVGKWTTDTVVESFDIQLAANPTACADLLHLDEQVLIALLIKLGRITSQIKEIASIEDPATRTMLALEAAKEVTMGAEPGAVQGHNVLHSSTGIMDQIHRLGIICARGQEGNETVQSDNYSSGLSQFAGGVGFIDGGWQVLGSFAAFISASVDLNSIRQLSEEQRRAKYGSWAKTRKAESALISGAKTAQTVSSLVTAIQGASAVAQTVPKGLVPGIGIATSLATIAHSSYKAGKSFNRHQRLSNKLKNLSTTTVLSENVSKYLAYAMAKAKRKGIFRAAEAGTATVGLGASTCLTVGAIVAGANCWNPVGWGLGIATFAAGSGLLVRKIYRSATSKSRNLRLWGFTRDAYPKLVINCFLSCFGKNYQSADTEVMITLLEAYGVKPLDLLVGNGSAGLATEKIKRHLEA